MSMTGQTTAVRSLFITDRRASNQPVVHSQWASRKVRTGPLATRAPFSLALMRPMRVLLRRIFVGTGRVEM